MDVVAKNRRARHDFAITDTVEAGLILTGQEVKSCRAGTVHLAGAYVSFHGGKPMIKGMKISPYRFASGTEDYDPGRDRQLLLSKRDISRLRSALDEKGVSLVPLEVRAGRHIKLLLGLGKGQSRIDKRAKIREKDLGKKLRRGEDY